MSCCASPPSLHHHRASRQPAGIGADPFPVRSARPGSRAPHDHVRLIEPVTAARRAARGARSGPGPMNAVTSAISLAAQGQHVDRPAEVCAGAVVPEVGGHRRLAVGAGREVAPGAAPGQRDPHGEVGDGVEAAVPVRQRRHRPGDVLGEQRDQGVGVAAFQRGGVPGDDLAQARVVDLAQRLLLAGAGTFSATIRRARCRALFTDAVEVSIVVAISAAEKPRTSNSSSAARWLPGRCCSAATNASSTASRCS